MNQSKTKLISFRINTASNERLLALKPHLRRSKSSLINEAIELFLINAERDMQAADQKNASHQSSQK